MFLVMIITGVLVVMMGLTSVKYIGIVLFLQASFVTGFFPIGLVAIAKTFNREMRSLAMGIILAVSNIFGSGITPYLLGVSGDVHSFRLYRYSRHFCGAGKQPLVFRLRELE